MMNQQMSQKQLLQWINMVSFAVNDITLYLDTHPDDEEALNYLKHYKELRKQGLRPMQTSMVLLRSTVQK